MPCDTGGPPFPLIVDIGGLRFRHVGGRQIPPSPPPPKKKVLSPYLNPRDSACQALFSNASKQRAMRPGLGLEEKSVPIQILLVLQAQPMVGDGANFSPIISGWPGLATHWQEGEPLFHGEGGLGRITCFFLSVLPSEHNRHLEHAGGSV